MRCSTAACAVFLALVGFASSGSASESTDAALAKAKSSGQPLLVIVTSANCGHCIALKARLKSDAAVNRFAGQYVSAEISANGPEMSAWFQKHKPHGNGLPQVFIVSSQGDDILYTSGNPPGDALPKILALGLTGNAEFKKAAAQLEKVQAALKKKGAAEAAAILASVPAAPKSKEEGSTVVYPPPAYVQLEKMKTDMLAEADSELAAASKDLEPAEESLSKFVDLVSIRRRYGAFAPVNGKNIEIARQGAKESEDSNVVGAGRVDRQGRCLQGGRQDQAGVNGLPNRDGALSRDESGRAGEGAGQINFRGIPGGGRQYRDIPHP